MNLIVALGVVSLFALTALAQSAAAAPNAGAAWYELLTAGGGSAGATFAAFLAWLKLFGPNSSKQSTPTTNGSARAELERRDLADAVANRVTGNCPTRDCGFGDEARLAMREERDVHREQLELQRKQLDLQVRQISLQERTVEGIERLERFEEQKLRHRATNEV
jgi:hypothetical protein